jgi:hypothetical protein
MTIKWITPAGSLGTLTERITVSFPLSATSTVGEIEYSVIAGRLPRGLRLRGNSIVGSPTEVRKFTTSRFVIRASDGSDIEDRTFALTVDGDDIPQWITKEGFLNVGPGDAFFVLDNSKVDLQLEVRDPDVIAGDILEFYLLPSGGGLPPGLSLSKSGKISGFTDPIFALEYNDDPSGAYDTAAFDIVPLDVSAGGTTGFDSFLYDFETFDTSGDAKSPRRLSRFYTFIIAVTDGIHEVRRVFRIWVVTEEFLKSDNSLIQVDTNIFQADSGPARKPIWITDSDLGRIRANNYVTLFLDVYDPPSLPGTIVYFLLPTNPGQYQLKETGQIIAGNYEISGDPLKFKYLNRDRWKNDQEYKIGDSVFYFDDEDSTITSIVWVCIANNKNKIPTEGNFWTKEGINTQNQTFEATSSSLWTTIVPESESIIPPGLTLDAATGNLAGRVPYQAAVSKTYQFTLEAVSFPPILFDENYTIVGDWNSTVTYTLEQAVRYDGFLWLCIQPHTNRRPEIESEFWDRGVSTEAKTFTAEIIGEIESAVEWITEEDLGVIQPNIPSKLQLEANVLLYGSTTIYDFIKGSLPPGLELIPNGQIQGKVKQFSDSQGLGLTRFYEKIDSAIDESSRSTDFGVSFDRFDTSFDREFKFTVRARDVLNAVQNDKEFKLFVNAEKNYSFSNLFVKAFQAKNKRLAWYNFITDSDVFRENEIYRYGDPSFGIQPELKMLVYAGIESRDAEFFIQAMSRNHYRKQIRFGDVKSAVAKDPVTQRVLYEVVYIDIVDEFEKNGKSISRTVELPNNINSRVLVSYDAISVDSDIPFASDQDHQRIFPNSFKNMRARIKAVGDRDREFLPLWMRSIQQGTFVEPGFVKAVILCYLKPGFSPAVLSRIRSKGFDFKTMDFTADRYLIDNIGNESQDKYLAFSQRDVLNKLENPSHTVDTTFTVIISSFDNDLAFFDNNSITFDQE